MSTRKLRRKYRPSSHSNNVAGKSRIIRRALTHRREIDHGVTWYIIRAAFRSVRSAELSLRAAGVKVYRPAEDRWRVHKHRCSDVSRDWLGRYLFAGLGPDAGPDELREVDGVESILALAGTQKPVTVRPELLQDLADQIAGYRKAPPAPFKEGQDVLVAAGPFAELRGIVEEADEQSGRASVAIEMFGKTHMQELDFLDLKAA
jgi:transcription antitermination factor NusG